MLNKQVSKLKKLFELSLTLSGDPIDIFRQSAKMIGEMLEVRVVCLSEIEGKQLNFLAVYCDGRIYCDAGFCQLAVTPCATVLEAKDFRVYEYVQQRFPNAKFLKEHNAFAYCGFPSLDNYGNVVAVTCLLDDKPHDFTAEDQELLQIFGQRIGMEIERKHNIEANERINAALKINQDRLHQVICLSATGVFDYNHATDSFYCSPELRLLFSWDANEQVTARTFIASIYLEDQPRVLEILQPSLNSDGNGVFEIEYRIVRRDGETRWLGAHSQTFSTCEGNICRAVRTVGAVQDITEKKLTELEQRLFATAFQTKEGVMIADKNFFIVRVNQAFTDITGYSTQEAIGNKPSMLKSDRHDRDFFRELDEKLENEGYWQGEIWDRHKDGHIFPKWMTVTAVKDNDEDISHYVAVFSDISEKSIDTAFWENENKLFTILDSVDASIFIKNCNYQYLYANQQVRQLFGKALEDIIGKTNDSFFDPVTTARMHEADSRVIELGERMAYEETIQIGDDLINTTFFTIKQPLRRKDGSIYGLCGISTNITERKQSEAKLNAIFNAAAEGIISYDMTGIIASVNAAVESIFGYKPEELIGCGIHKLKLSKETLPFTPDNPKQIQEVEGLRKNGAAVPLDLSRAEYSIDNQRFFTIIVRDISLRKQREKLDKMHLAELAHVTRLGLMAQMASGIAHEINQPLAAVNSYTQASLNLIKAGNSNPAELSDILHKAQQQAMRAGQIIHRMREFLKSESTHRSTVDINGLINDAVSLCMDEIKKNIIQLSFDLGNNLPQVSADHIQIEQVLINLIRNSIDVLQSIPETQLRHLSIHSQITGNNEIQIRVKDNGLGIDLDQQQKILTPFYTTKTYGMGMGLSICRSLMESHGGSLSFRSQPGKGTSFYLTLPIIH